MHLFIKNVCHRCTIVVQTELEKLGLSPVAVTLGEVVMPDKELPEDILYQIKNCLEKVGFEIIEGKKSRLIEKIKSVIINLIHHLTEPSKQKYSDVITAELHYDYPYLSKLFAQFEGITIEHYIIQQKIEKVKELLIYDELTLGQISFNTGYNNISHLSAQFKKITGMTPSQFRLLSTKNRKALDKVGKSAK